jgi:hypothetical protein
MKGAVIFVRDNLTGFDEEVIEQTNTSWNITQKKRTIKGISCTNWFDMTTPFNIERFSKLETSNHAQQ